MYGHMVGMKHFDWPFTIGYEQYWLIQLYVYI